VNIYIKYGGEVTYLIPIACPSLSSSDGGCWCWRVVPGHGGGALECRRRHLTADWGGLLLLWLARAVGASTSLLSSSDDGRVVVVAGGGCCCCCCCCS